MYVFIAKQRGFGSNLFLQHIRILARDGLVLIIIKMLAEETYEKPKWLFSMPRLIFIIDLQYLPLNWFCMVISHDKLATYSSGKFYFRQNTMIQEQKYTL